MDRWIHKITRFGQIGRGIESRETERWIGGVNRHAYNIPREAGGALCSRQINKQTNNPQRHPVWFQFKK